MLKSQVMRKTATRQPQQTTLIEQPVQQVKPGLKKKTTTKQTALVKQPVQPVKPTSIYLPHGLHARLRTTAFSEGRPMNKLIISAVEQYLKGGK